MSDVNAFDVDLKSLFSSSVSTDTHITAINNIFNELEIKFLQNPKNADIKLNITLPDTSNLTEENKNILAFLDRRIEKSIGFSEVTLTNLTENNYDIYEKLTQNYIPYQKRNNALTKYYNYLDIPKLHQSLSSSENQENKPNDLIKEYLFSAEFNYFQNFQAINSFGFNYSKMYPVDNKRDNGFITELEWSKNCLNYIQQKNEKFSGAPFRFSEANLGFNGGSFLDLTTSLNDYLHADITAQPFNKIKITRLTSCLNPDPSQTDSLVVNMLKIMEMATEKNILNINLGRNLAENDYLKALKNPDKSDSINPIAVKNELDFLNKTFDALLQSEAYQKSRTLLFMDPILSELTSAASKLDNNNEINIALDSMKDKYKQLQGQIAKNQREYNKALREGNLSPADELKKTAPSSSTTGIIKRNRSNALDNISSEINQQQEQQEEQQQEQQEEQQVELQQQRQSNIQALKDRMNGDDGEKLKKSKSDYIDKDTFISTTQNLHRTPLSTTWENIAGKKLSPDQPSIVAISPQVADMLNSNHDFFKSGLSLDALPPGFILHQDKDNPKELILDYSTTKYELDLASLGEEQNKNVIYPVSESRKGIEIEWVGDERQFTDLSKGDFETVSDYGKFKKLIKDDKQKAIDLMIRFMNSETPNFIDVQKKDIVQKIASAYFDGQQLTFLMSNLNKYGAQGPYLIFEKTFNLENKFGQDLTNRFVDLFLKNTNVAFDAMLSQNNISAFSDLTKLSPNEFSLFVQLCENDCKTKVENSKDFIFNPNINLEQRLKDFNHFKTELKNLGIDLNLTPLNAESHGFRSQNMAVIMQRMVSILKNSIDPVAQFKHLDRLDFSPYKAYQAISEGGYCFVTNDMKFGDATYDKLKKDLSKDIAHYTQTEFLGEDALPENFYTKLNSSFSEFIYLNNFLSLNNQKLPPEYYFEGLFLRTVGKSYNADQYNDYVAINNAYQAAYGRYSQKYDRRIKSVSAHALAITAFATIHENAFKIDPSHYTKMVDQLMTDDLQGDRGINLCQSLLSYLHLAENPEVKRPQLEQISSLIDFHKALGIDHPWNAPKFNKKDSLIDLYHPDKIAFLKITEKLGDSYFEVIHQNYLYRPEDKATENAKNIASIATLLADDNIFKDLNLLNNRNNLFKILSYCDYTSFSQQAVTDFVSTYLNNLDKNKLAIALDVLGSLKFKDANAPHPTFEELKTVLDKVNLLENTSEDKVFNVIRNASGFSGCVFPVKKAAEYNGDKLKQLIQENIEEIKPHLSKLGILWKEEFSEDPKLLIREISASVKGNPLKQGLIDFAMKQMFAMMEDGAKNNINDHILHSLGAKDQNEIFVNTPESNDLIALQEKKYFNNLNLKSDINNLEASLDIIDAYEKQAIAFIDKLTAVKNVNPVAYKNAVRYLKESPDLNKISLENLTNLIDVISKNYKTKFPSTLLQTITAHPALKDIDSDKTHALLNEIIIPKIINNKNLGLNVKELNSLISAVINISAHRDIELRNINIILSLLNNKETKNELIKIIQTIAKNPNPEIINDIRIIAPVVENTPEIRTTFYSKFNDKLNDLSTIGKTLNNSSLGLTDDEKKNILIILSKTKYTYPGNNKESLDNKLNDLLEKMTSIPDKEKRADFLSKIAALSLPIQIPYPGATELIETINANKTADDLIKGLYEKLEKSRNDPVELDKLFDTSQVDRVLENMQNLVHEKGLRYPEKKLAQEQFHTVNHLGRYVELPVDLNQPDGKKNFIKNMEDSEIKNLLSQYRAFIRDENRSPKEKDNAKLVYLALLRESMHRATGRFPFSTQIIAVLQAMNHDKNIKEIQTGQGKSLMSSLYAAMLHAEGQAVDVATSNLQLAKDGLHENKDFYAYIGVKVGVVTASMDFSDYHHDGINYSDVPQLALFRSRAYIEGGKLPDKVSLVLDEADYTLLDDKTQYRYAASLDPSTSSQNVFAWVYPLINKFIDDPNQSETADNLRSYLMQNAPSRYARIIQNKEFLPNKQLDTWIDAAISAEALYKQRDTAWTLRQEEKNGKPISAAKLITNHIVSSDAQWSNGVHQFVHARINEENKEAIEVSKFPPALIEPEKSALASLTSKNFIDYYRNGKIWGMTGTIGSTDEKREHAEKSGFALFSLPPHQQEQRITHDPILIDSDAEHKKAIFNEILKRIRKKEKMPALIICKDPKTAEELHLFIQTELQKSNKHYPLTLQLISGIKTSQQSFEPNSAISEPNSTISEEDAVKQASIGGTITISTPMLGRGTDFKPVEDKINERTNERDKHPHGLFVVQSYVDIERTSRQISGRSGRQGAKGEFMTLISKEALDRDLKSVGLQEDKIKKKKIQEYIQKIREKRNYTAKEQRQQTEVLGDIRNLYFNKMLLMKDNLSEYYDNEKNKYNIEMQKEKAEDRKFDHIDQHAISFNDVDLYRISLLKNWETFLLDLDLKKAEILSADKKPTINELTNQLLTQANNDWRIKFGSFSSMMNTPTTQEAKPLENDSLSAHATKITERAFASKHVQTPEPEVSRRLSVITNLDKLVCRVLPNVNQNQINKATHTELNNLYTETTALFKKNKVSKNKYPVIYDNMSLHDKITQLYSTLNYLRTETLLKPNASIPSAQYLQLITKLENHLKWHLAHSSDAEAKQTAKNVIFDCYEKRCTDFIRHNRFDLLIRYQQDFAAKSPGFGITENEYIDFKDKKLNNTLFSGTLNKHAVTLTKENKKRIGYNRNKKLLSEFSEIMNETSRQYQQGSSPENHSAISINLMDTILKHKKTAYFGDSAHNIRPIPTKNSYHQKLDNLMMGLIASGDKTILEKAYTAELQDLNLILSYIKHKYADNPDISKLCENKLLLLHQNTLSSAQLAVEIKSLQKQIPSESLRTNLQQKINHIEAIQVREKLFNLDLKSNNNITPIAFEKDLKEKASAFKSPLSFLAHKISRHRTIIEINHLPSLMNPPPPMSTVVLPIFRSNATTNTSSSSTTNKPNTIRQEFRDSQNKTMLQLELDSYSKNGKVLMARGIDMHSDDFKTSAKTAIDKAVEHAKETATFKVSDKVPERIKQEITDYLKQKLDEKFPNQNNEAKINPHLKNTSQHSQKI